LPSGQNTKSEPRRSAFGAPRREEASERGRSPIGPPRFRGKSVLIKGPYKDSGEEPSGGKWWSSTISHLKKRIGASIDWARRVGSWDQTSHHRGEGGTDNLKGEGVVFQKKDKRYPGGGILYWRKVLHFWPFSKKRHGRRTVLNKNLKTCNSKA